ncbi:MAG: hypothetical protein M1819_007151 [Sarea resinae]|nr:MAG: hypothetical protein M1819_007151 [Sarea resinae]
MPPKRKRDSDVQDDQENLSLNATPSKVRFNDAALATPIAESGTPTKRGRGRPPGSKNKIKPLLNDSTNGKTPTPLKGRKLFSTPTKLKPQENASLAGSPPSIIRNADRSARRKSARSLIERTIIGNLSDEDDDLGQEDLLARRIWDEEDEGDEGDELDGAVDNNVELLPAGPDTLGDQSKATAATPVKRGRGRPKGSRNKRTPTPPLADLPPHETYFFQTRPGGIRTSNNTLSSLSLLTHDEYFSLMRAYKEPHAEERQFLEELHVGMFEQWRFEMSEGFNVCLYGYGDKRTVVTKFAQHLHDAHSSEDGTKSPSIIIINGSSPTLTPKVLLSTLASTLSPSQTPTTGTAPSLSSILPVINPTYLLIHSLDFPPLRRPTHPLHTVLPALLAHPSIKTLVTTTHPLAPLLPSLSSSAGTAKPFLYHDTTTFAPSSHELNPVDTIHELLGRAARRVNGRDGVIFVLRSLPENARSLFRCLVAEQLAGMDSDGGAGMGELGGQAGASTGAEAEGGAAGVEYRTLYNKALEEFICSNEVAFRTLLKEFHDHQIITSRRDGLGSEILSVPFEREELEALLIEELV